MTLRRIILALAITCRVACAQSADEYRVKAAFLFNFTKFVEWPSLAFHDTKDPIYICVFGSNPFGTALKEAVHGKVIQNRVLEVRLVADPAQSNGCQVLFVPASERKQLRPILDAAAGHGVLTIGEADWFLRDGGVINLRIESGSVRIQVNPQAADQQHLQISSKLLSLAEIVR